MSSKKSKIIFNIDIKWSSIQNWLIIKFYIFFIYDRTKIQISSLINKKFNKIFYVRVMSDISLDMELQRWDINFIVMIYSLYDSS